MSKIFRILQNDRSQKFLRIDIDFIVSKFNVNVVGKIVVEVRVWLGVSTTVDS